MKAKYKTKLLVVRLLLLIKFELDIPAKVWEEMKSKAWYGNKRSQPSQSQAILTLSFSKDQRFSSLVKLHLENNTSLFEMTQKDLKEITLKEPKMSVIVEELQEHPFVSKVKGDIHFFTGEERVNHADGNVPDTENIESSLASCFGVQEDQNHRPQVKQLEPESVLDDPMKNQSTLNTDPGKMVCCEGYSEGTQRGSIDNLSLKVGPGTVGEYTCEEEICQETILSLIVNTKYADLKSEKPLYSVEQSQPGDSEFKGNVVEEKTKTQAESLAHITDKDLEDINQCTANKRQETVEEETNGKAEMGESSNKVTFLLEPEVINESTLTESITSMESTTCMSGENNKLLVGVTEYGT